ncbi:MAG: acyl-CoA thioesterase [Chitinophagaceae bacterium]|nr:acyl-CoA thioesterase [Chitinophagaceae bacterium]
MQKTLSGSIEINVRFNEADPLGIVWHGHYIRYFEDGREAFGNEHGIGYLDFYRQGIIIPIVSIHCEYKRSLKYGERVRVETKYIPCDAAKLMFEYRLYNPVTGQLVANGDSVQVFLDKETSLLQLTNPPFFENWKKEQGFL